MTQPAVPDPYIEGVDGLLYPHAATLDPTWAAACQTRAARAGRYLERKAVGPRPTTTCGGCQRPGRFLTPGECCRCKRERERLAGSDRRPPVTECRTCGRSGRWHRPRHCKVCAREQRRIATRNA